MPCEIHDNEERSVFHWGRSGRSYWGEIYFCKSEAYFTGELYVMTSYFLTFITSFPALLVKKFFLKLSSIEGAMGAVKNLISHKNRLSCKHHIS